MFQSIILPLIFALIAFVASFLSALFLELQFHFPFLIKLLLLIFVILITMITFGLLRKPHFRKRVIVVLVLWVLALNGIILWVFIRENYLKPKWSAILYRNSNKGKSPIVWGPYWTRGECETQSQRALAQPVLIDGEPVEASFCGKSCSQPLSFRGDMLIDEIECEGEQPPRPNS